MAKSAPDGATLLMATVGRHYTAVGNLRRLSWSAGFFRKLRKPGFMFLASSLVIGAVFSISSA